MRNFGVSGKFISFLSVFSLMVVIFSLSPSAYALSMADNTAEIYWSLINITIDPNINITWTHKESDSGAGVIHNNFSIVDEDQIFDWVPTSAHSAIINGQNKAIADAFTDSEKLYESAYAYSDLGDFYFSVGGAYRHGRFTVSGDGNINIEVPYYIKMNMAGYLPGDHAEGFSLATLMLFNETSSLHDVGDDQFSDSIYGANFIDQSRFGTLSVILAFNDGDSGSFSTGAINLAIVGNPPPIIPEPSTLFLLASGLAGMIGLGRKRLFKKA